MIDKKVSIVLAAADKFTAPFQSATQKMGKLKMAADETSQTLRGLEKKQRLVEGFKSLSSRVDDARSALLKAKKETAGFRDSERQASLTVKQHATALKKAEQAVLEVAESYGAESKQVALARREVVRLAKAKKQAEKELKKERAALKTAEDSVGRLTAAYGRQSKELGGLRREVGQAGLNLNALGAEELRLAKRADQANKVLDRQAAKLKQVHQLQSRIHDRKMMRNELMGDAVGLAVKAAPMVMAGRKAISYESAFADVKKVVNFSSAEEAEVYKINMLKLAGDLGMSQHGLAEIVTEAGQSGIEKDQLLKFGESAAKMSVAWDVSAKEAGGTLATWRAAMGLTQDKALDLADATNYLSNNMNAKAKDIAAVMVRQGSTAMNSGLNYNQAAALSATLIAGGATEEVAATALKNITGRLTTGYAATSGQQMAMGKLGFDAEELAAAMQSDGQGTLVEVFRSLQDVASEERGAVISQLFGEEVKGAVSKVVTTLDDDKNGLIKAFSRIAKQQDRHNSVNKEYENKAKTRSHTLSRLSSKFDHMVISLGDRLLPVVDALAPPLMAVIDGVSSFAQESPKLTTAIMGAAGSLVVAKAGFVAYKLASLAFGNGADRLRLGRVRLTRTTDATAKSASLASRALAGVNRQLSGLGRAGLRRGRQFRERVRQGRGAKRRRLSLSLAAEGAEHFSREGRKGRTKPWGRLGALAGGGAALSLLSGTASAGDLAMAGSGVASLVGGGLIGALPTVGRLGGHLFKPLGVALQGAGIMSALSSGDGAAMGGAAGDIVGGLGGMAAGAALGSLIFPGVGTAIGAAIGGFSGSELGGWVGEKLADWFGEDKTAQAPPASVAATSKGLQQVNRQIQFSPTIHITPSGNVGYDQQMGEALVARMKDELSPLLLGNSDVATRADASLTDRYDT